MSAVVGALLALAPGAQAQGISELKVGILAHDVGPFTDRREKGADLNLEVLFDSPDVLKPIWAPRPHLGASLSAAGDTSHAYAGLTWTVDMTPAWFADLSFGGAVHNGENETFDPDRKALGCKVLFRESIGLGYRVTPRQSVMLYLSHLSNASLCSPNEGLEAFGIRYGYRF